MPAGMRAILDACPRPIPSYGTEEWSELPKADPRRLAAVIIAAECWRTWCEETPERLADELAAENRRCISRWGDAANDMRGAPRMSNAPPPSAPSFAELQDRRRY